MSTEKLIPWTQFAADQRKAASRVAPLDIIEPIAWQGQDIPPRRWLVEPLIPEGAVSALYGNGGEGKSIVALQLLIAAALGRDWLGLPVRRCKALGIFCEDEPEELHRRVSAILKFYDAEPGDLEGLRLVSRVGTMNAMLEYPDRWNPGEETAFFGQVMNQALEFGAELVTLDSLHDLFPGDENNRQHARQFVNTLRTIATEIGGAVLLVAHPSRAGMLTGTGDGGSTAWNNTFRSRLYLRSADPELDGPVDRVLEHGKANYSGKLDPIGLVWNDGVFVANRPPTGIVAHLENNNVETAFLEALDAANTQGRPLSVSVNASNFAPKVIVKMPEAKGARRRDLEAAMNRLLSANEIINEPYGPPSKDRRRLVRKALELGL